MTKTLQKKFPDLIPIRVSRPSWFKFARRAASKVTSGRIDLGWSQSLARRHAREIARQLKAERAGTVISIANSSISAYLGEIIPMIHVSDATVPLMSNYYGEFARLRKSVADSAWQLDIQSVLNARECLYSTEWASQSAIRDYKADRSRVHTISWGANIEHRPALQPDPPEDLCHLVFIGVDWERKGGQIAVDTVNLMASRGHRVMLHIIGASPTIPKSDAITVHGFIDKRTEEGRAKFDTIMRQAALLFVPTRQDCSPMIFPEANAYGIPVITTSTGGVPYVVEEGVNGFLLPPEAPPEAYSNIIWSIWSDQERYKRLRRSSQARFEQRLNWDSWLESAAPIIQSVMDSTR